MGARNPASQLAFPRCSPRKAAGALRCESLHRKVGHGGHPALKKDAARTQHYFCARRAPALKKDTVHAQYFYCARWAPALKKDTVHAQYFYCARWAPRAEERCCACAALFLCTERADATGECGWSGVRVALDSCCRARPSRTEPQRVTKARETRAAPRACQGRASREWDRYSTVRA